ncbi:MAG TPA: prepilin-type N-terminal cleavage/methylation domain-containing protein [Thermoanaerobaculia bacterium]|nr:prepilin-type N-terminal cleavage/methylation domain-containing protein [Thermoanaerobaculia bacterium]
MAHPSTSDGEARRLLRRRRRSRSWRSGFTLAELAVVIAIGSLLLLLGYPALMKVLARYEVRSSAQQLEMLGREARYESIKLNQPVTLVADTTRHNFYVFSGTLPNMPPYSLPDGPGDIPGPQLVAVWEVPKSVSFVMQPVTSCVQGTVCQSFSFNSDGTGTGVPVIFSTPNQPSSKVVLAQTATGKLAIQ